MRKLALLVAIGAALSAQPMPSAQATAGSLKAAADALGVANIRTLQFTGAGSAFALGQNYLSTEAWPPVLVKSFSAAINFDTASMRQEQVRDQSVAMPRGGGAPFNGAADVRQIQVVSGDYAWNVPAAAGAQAAAAPANQLERMLFVWSTPQGFVKAAMANNAATRKVPGGTEVSFAVGGKYKMTGLINARNEVERVQTWIDQSIVGDMLVETTYSNYYDFGGILFPTRMVQKQDGFPLLDLAIASVVANPAVDIAVPDNVKTPPAPAPVMVASQKLADGVYYLTGGTHHSLAVEMSDHIVLVDTPNSEQRALAVIAKTKELIPNKPIRFIVTSHHHWDHLGGIRTAMDEGATIVTHESNRAFLERVAKTPHTIAPDRLAASKKPVKIQTVGDDGKLTDGTRTIELHRMQGFKHAGDLLLVYLPKEKILAEPDAYTPPATPMTPLNPAAQVLAQQLYDNIQRLKLDVQTIAPFHGARTADMAELGRLSGRATTGNTN